MHKTIIFFLAASLLLWQGGSFAKSHKKTTNHSQAKHLTHSVPTAQSVFIDEMVTKYNFDRKKLTILFSQIKVRNEVLPQIKHPFEKKAWYAYRRYFVKDERAQRGALFWLKNEGVLNEASKKYGVPPSIIVAILGVETDYGMGEGRDPVLDTLYTLAFYYPPRADFFRQQLAEFLLLARELDVDPTTILGSYAGAMGMPQFMPSSYRYYAVSYSGKKSIDLFKNVPDVVMSVANYFKENGWQQGQPVAVQARVVGNGYQAIINSSLKAKYPLSSLEKHGITSEQIIPDDTLANLIVFQGKEEYEYWLGLHNFYVITRYNPSPAYAMAVYQLALRIEDKYRALKKH